MNIKAPLTAPYEVTPLVDAGATEFYAGLRLGKNIYSGTRPFERSHFNDFGSFREAVQEARRRNVNVAFCCNTCFDKGKTLLVSSIEKVMKIGVRIIIVSNPGVLIDLRRYFPENTYVLSTLANCFNSYTVEFFEELGISSIILPRELTLDEIKLLCGKNNNMKFVVFIHNIKCEFINGSCNLHRLLTAVSRQSKIIRFLFYNTTGSIKEDCKAPYTIKVFNKYGHSDVKKNIFLTDYLGLRCGACAIPFLKNAAIYGVKIIGREYPFFKKLLDVKFISAVVRLEKKKCASLSNSIRSLYKEIYGKECNPPHECHFPIETTEIAYE